MKHRSRVQATGMLQAREWVAHDPGASVFRAWPDCAGGSETAESRMIKHKRLGLNWSGYGLGQACNHRLTTPLWPQKSTFTSLGLIFSTVEKAPWPQRYHPVLASYDFGSSRWGHQKVISSIFLPQDNRAFICRHHLWPVTLPLHLFLLHLRKSFYSVFIHFIEDSSSTH